MFLTGFCVLPYVRLLPLFSSVLRFRLVDCFDVAGLFLFLMFGCCCHGFASLVAGFVLLILGFSASFGSSFVGWVFGLECLGSAYLLVFTCTLM